MITNALATVIRHPFRAVIFLAAGYLVFMAGLMIVQTVLLFVVDTASYVTHDPLHNGPGGLLLLAIIAIVVLVVWRWCRVHLPQWRPRARGARWATWQELQREGFLAPHGWPLGSRPTFWGRQVLRLPERREREGCLIVAQTGTGKTAGMVVPALLAEARRSTSERRSLIVVDPKDELASLTRPALAATHRVLVWDPTNPAECTVRYDPLALLPSPAAPGFIDEVRHVSDSWCDTTREGDFSTDPIWQTMARHYMRAVLLTYLDAHPSGASFVDLGDWVRRLAYEDLLTCVEHARSQHVTAFAQTMRSVGLNERMSGSVFSDIQHRFEALDTPHIRAAMKPGQTIDWDSFVREPTVVFVKLPARDAKQLGALLSLFLAQGYRALTGIASRQSGNVLSRGVRVVIDELGTLPRIYGLESALATMRSYGAGHLLCMQSRSQLAMTYGAKLAQSIQDNLVTCVVLGGASDEDARWMSNRLGQRTEYHRRRTQSAGGLYRGLGSGASFGFEPDTRPLIPPEEITHFTGRVYVSTHGLPPVRLKLRSYWQQKGS